MVKWIKIRMDEKKLVEAVHLEKCLRKRITTHHTASKVVCLQCLMFKELMFPKVRRRLAEESLVGSWPIKKPRLIVTIKNQGLQCAKRHRLLIIRVEWEQLFQHGKVKFMDYDYCNILLVCFFEDSSFQILVDKSAFIRWCLGEQFYFRLLCRKGLVSWWDL